MVPNALTMASSSHRLVSCSSRSCTRGGGRHWCGGPGCHLPRNTGPYDTSPARGVQWLPLHVRQGQQKQQGAVQSGRYTPVPFHAPKNNARVGFSWLACCMYTMHHKQGRCAPAVGKQ